MKYSKRSRSNLDTCHQDLQKIFDRVILKYDNTAICGARTDSEQFKLYKKGRKLAGDAWIIEDKSKVVTYKDGYNKKSKHQPPEGSILSMALDAVPYPIDWDDTEGFIAFGNYVKGVADTLLDYGEIEHALEWGGDWKWKDMPHFQLVSRHPI